ncbi:MAG: 16S rRNA (cytosine(1402)-N(4))-methyltransferase RsmH [Melioribacteraceae bacterium]|nr:16S rRNA (cytosine(1402)-N(4))-methyltransferase RsmH [Melioribacteraceae bacterium]
MKKTTRHIPVLLNGSVSHLVTNVDGNYFEGTVGFGGHTEEILSRLSEKGRLIGTDKDVKAFEYCIKKFKNEQRVSIFNTSYTNIDTIAKLELVEKFDGIFLDLGVSSYQLDDPDSGFTYREEAELDLRMNKNQGYPAYYYLNELSEEELADIFYNYGEEKKSRQIARVLVKSRLNKTLKTTTQLKSIIESIIGKYNLNKTLSRIFQALRIHVNNELDELKEILNKSTDLLNPGGRLAVISFHSLEDRIVKDYFKYEAATCVCPDDAPVCVCNKQQRLSIITRKPVTASDEELQANPRSRSAKLRVAERL